MQIFYILVKPNILMISIKGYDYVDIREIGTRAPEKRLKTLFIEQLFY